LELLAAGPSLLIVRFACSLWTFLELVAGSTIVFQDTNYLSRFPFIHSPLVSKAPPVAAPSSDFAVQDFSQVFGPFLSDLVFLNPSCSSLWYLSF